MVKSTSSLETEVIGAELGAVHLVEVGRVDDFMVSTETHVHTRPCHTFYIYMHTTIITATNFCLRSSCSVISVCTPVRFTDPGI
jgi:hypothetical protein